MIAGQATSFLDRMVSTVSNLVSNKSSAPAPKKPSSLGAPAPKPDSTTKPKPNPTNTVPETPQTDQKSFVSTTSPEETGEKPKENVRTKLQFESPAGEDEIFGPSSLLTTEQQLEEDLRSSPGKFTSLFARRVSQQFQAETAQRPASVSRVLLDTKMPSPRGSSAPPSSNDERVKRKADDVFTPDAARRVQKATDAGEEDFVLPTEQAKKLDRKKKQAEKKEKKEAEKAEKEKKDAEKAKKNASNKSAAKKTRASARHSKF